MREYLLDLVPYKRDLLTQILLVATILGAFSVSGLFALMSGSGRGKLHSYLFTMLTLSSLAFVFATTLDAILLPAMSRVAESYSVEHLRGILKLGDVVILSVIAGTFSLIAGIAASGFAMSRRIGIVVLVASVLTMLVFIACAAYLSHLAGH